MRFSLTQLLLLFPAYGIAYWLAFLLFAPDLVSFQHTAASTRCRQYQTTLSYSDEFYMSDHGERLPLDVINHWLAGRTTEPYDDCRILLDAEFDPWGNAYQATYRTDADQSIGVYSLGQNGISNSAGNDADDLNSWSNQGHRWYFRQYRQHLSMICAAFAVPLLPVGYFILRGIGKLLRATSGLFAGMRWPRRRSQSIEP